jgi:uncharacterized membrane protein
MRLLEWTWAAYLLKAWRDQPIHAFGKQGDKEVVVFTVFDLFKFLHIASAIVWIGGAVTLTILNVRVRRTGDRAAMAALGQQSAVLGRILLGPAAASTFVTGLVMIAEAGIAFTTLWVLWGTIAIALSMYLGAGPIRRTGEELAIGASNPKPEHARVAALGNRLRTLNAVNLIVLFSAVWAMVFKPTL